MSDDKIDMVDFVIYGAQIELLRLVLKIAKGATDKQMIVEFIEEELKTRLGDKND